MISLRNTEQKPQVRHDIYKTDFYRSRARLIRNRFFLLLFLPVILTSCFEYRVSGRELKSNLINDNYRTFYEIFVGAFSDSNNDGIGDLKGLINRLDYLNDGKPNSGKSLGIDGIWLMPIMPSPSYHKYDVMDYYAIDPRYGTMADFEKLIAECNKRGIKLIIDLVLNHTSSQHPWFVNAKNAISQGNFDVPYIDYYVIKTEKVYGRTWYELEKSPDGTQYFYEGNFSIDMPELNLDNHEVRQEIINIAKFWLDMGVGGFRLDAVSYIYFREVSSNIEFLKWFNNECKKIRDDVYIVAENWANPILIQEYYEAVNCFDFGMSGTLGDVYTTVMGKNNANTFTHRLAAYQKQVLEKNPNAILQPFIFNHDMDRAAEFLSVEDYRMHIAANLYILSSGSPFIYYGEEIGMKGLRGSTPTDADRRLAMLWGDKDTVTDPIGSTYDRANQTNGTVKSQLPNKDSLLNHYKKLIMLRNANPEIARGIIEPIDFAQYSSVCGFVSNHNGSKAAVIHNTGEDDITIDLSSHTNEIFTILRGYAGKGKASLNGSTLVISGLTSVILR